MDTGTGFIAVGARTSKKIALKINRRHGKSLVYFEPRICNVIRGTRYCVYVCQQLTKINIFLMFRLSPTHQPLLMCS